MVFYLTFRSQVYAFLPVLMHFNGLSRQKVFLQPFVLASVRELTIYSPGTSDIEGPCSLGVEATASYDGRRVKSELLISYNEHNIKEEYSDEEWEGFSDPEPAEDYSRPEGSLPTLESEVVANGPPSTLKSEIQATDQPKILKSEVLVTGPASVLEATLPGLVPATKYETSTPAPVERKPRTDDEGTSRKPGTKTRLTRPLA